MSEYSPDGGWCATCLKNICECPPPRGGSLRLRYVHQAAQMLGAVSGKIFDEALLAASAFRTATLGNEVPTDSTMALAHLGDTVLPELAGRAPLGLIQPESLLDTVQHSFTEFVMHYTQMREAVQAYFEEHNTCPPDGSPEALAVEDAVQKQVMLMGVILTSLLSFCGLIQMIGVPETMAEAHEELLRSVEQQANAQLTARDLSRCQGPEETSLPFPRRRSDEQGH